MKKKLLCILLLISLFLLSSCSDELNWKDYFQVEYKHIEESKFEDPLDAIDALLDKTFVFEADEYTITNKTNEILTNIYLVFEVTPKYQSQSFQVKEWVGKLKQGESKVEKFFSNHWEMELENKGFSKDTECDVYLTEILFEIQK